MLVVAAVIVTRYMQCPLLSLCDVLSILLIVLFGTPQIFRSCSTKIRNHVTGGFSVESPPGVDNLQLEKNLVTRDDGPITRITCVPTKKVQNYSQ
jgi:hypothetical protein